MVHPCTFTLPGGLVVPTKVELHQPSCILEPNPLCIYPEAEPSIPARWPAPYSRTTTLRSPPWLHWRSCCEGEPSGPVARTQKWPCLDVLRYISGPISHHSFLMACTSPASITRSVPEPSLASCRGPVALYLSLSPPTSHLLCQHQNPREPSSWVFSTGRRPRRTSSWRRRRRRPSSKGWTGGKNPA